MDKTNTTKKSLFLLLLCILILPIHLFSQNKYKRKMSITEWIVEMEQCAEQLYWLEDAEIFYDQSKDSLYHWDQPRTEPTEKDAKAVKNIAPIIVIKNCKLPINLTVQLRNIVFQKNVCFGDCEGAGQLIFYNCTFKQGMDFIGSDLDQLNFEYCSILHRTVVIESHIGIFSFENCSFYTDRKAVESSYRVGYELVNQDHQYLFRISLNEKKINAFVMSKCKILTTDVIPIVAFSGGKYDFMSFDGINFSNCILDFSGCSVKEDFSILNCSFMQPFGAHKFSFPADNTTVDWRQIDSVGLGLYLDYPHVFTSKTDTLYSNDHVFNELNSTYRKFYSMYRTQGDMVSANACFMQMKDIETGRYHHLYQKHPSIEAWFNWRFNQFLKVFSKYGTSPVQSLIISMWTILLFAVVYFFFYSDWDGINRSFLIRKHLKVMQYFRSEQKLEDFYLADYVEDMKKVAAYKTEMAESKAEIPIFILLMGKPLYLLSIVKHKVWAFIYRRSEILQGRWIDLGPKRKAFVALTVGFSIALYLIWLAFIRALNSITLSVNVFSTLGFGAIPVKGVSRYITILEGFLGWFLLSIFSVSLISQMLQN